MANPGQAGKGRMRRTGRSAASTGQAAAEGKPGTEVAAPEPAAAAVPTQPVSDALFREAIIAAASEVGADGTGADGLKGYLRKIANDQFWRCTGAVTINLAAAATLTSGWCLWVRGNGGAVTIDPNLAELIDGRATIVIPDGQEALIQCDGAGFFTLFRTGQPAGYGTISSAATTDLSTIDGVYLDVTGTNAITALGTLPRGMVKVLRFAGALTFTNNAASLILPGGANITTAANDVAITVSEGSGNWRCISYTRAALSPAVLAPITSWVQYTPIFTGFGTVSNVDVRSRRVGENLEIRGTVTAGVPTATEARMTLGFNGTNANVTSGSIGSVINIAGYLIRNVVGNITYYTLIENGVGYITFSFQASSAHGQTKQNGNNLWSAGGGDTLSFTASVPINGW